MNAEELDASEELAMSLLEAGTGNNKTLAIVLTTNEDDTTSFKIVYRGGWSFVEKLGALTHAIAMIEEGDEEEV